MEYQPIEEKREMFNFLSAKRINQLWGLKQTKGVAAMTTAAILKEQIIETPEEAKARRNAEYLAMLEESLQQHAEGKVFVTTIEALEALTHEK